MAAMFLVSISLVFLNMLSYTYCTSSGEIVIREEWRLKATHYKKCEIKELAINSYKGGKGGTFTELIITFSDGRILTTNDDSEGLKKLLSKWQGDVKMTTDEN